jgi:hypothetical protein
MDALRDAAKTDDRNANHAHARRNIVERPAWCHIQSAQNVTPL